MMVGLLYMSPLATMYTVVKTRDTSSIDVRLASAQVCGVNKYMPLVMTQ